VGAGPRRVALRYAAPVECPDAGTYLNHVRSRSTNLDVEPAGEPALAAADSVDIRVEPEAGGGGWLGHVSIEGELALEREVRGERCEDVVAALAVITVLRFEGQARDAASESARTGQGSSPSLTPGSAGAGAEARGPEGPPAGSEPTPPPAGVAPPSPAAPPAPSSPPPPAVTPVTPGAAAAPAEPAEPSPPAEPPPEPPPVAELPATRAPAEAAPSNELDAVTPLQPDVGVPARRSGERADEERSSEATSQQVDTGRDTDAERAGAVWPEMAGGLAVYGGYASSLDHAFKAEIEAELRFGGSMSSWALVSSLAFSRGDAPTALAQSSLTLWTGQLGLCAPALLDQPSTWLRACLDVRAGALHFGIRARDPDLLRFEEESPWGPWLSVGPALQVGVPLDQHWSLRGMLQLAVQLLRNRRTVSGSDVGGEATLRYTLYRPEPVSLELELGIGYAF
jgi:hypothetical protein